MLLTLSPTCSRCRPKCVVYLITMDVAFVLIQSVGQHWAEGPLLGDTHDVCAVALGRDDYGIEAVARRSGASTE